MRGHFNLGSSLDALGRFAESYPVYADATAADPTYVNAWFNGATSLKELGRTEEAAAMYEMTIALAPGDADAHENLGICRQRQRRLVDAEAASRSAAALRPTSRSSLYTLITSLVWQKNIEKAEEARRLLDHAVATGMWSDSLQYPADYTPGIQSAPWPTVAQFPSVAPAIAILEGSWEAIRAEFVDHDLLSQAQDQFEKISEAGATPDARWTVIPAYHRGEACGCPGQGCDTVCGLLGQLQQHVTVTGIMYSVIGPGAHLRPHCGPHNRRLKFHLGLKVPQPTTMRIASETRSWEEGKCNFLDDSFEHEVTNGSDEVRVVLEVIFDHPDLQQPST